MLERNPYGKQLTVFPLIIVQKHYYHFLNMRQEAALLNMDICIGIYYSKFIPKCFFWISYCILGYWKLTFKITFQGGFFCYLYYTFVMYVLDLKIKYIFYPHWQHHLQKRPMGSIFESHSHLYYLVQRKVCFFSKIPYSIDNFWLTNFFI